MSLSKFSCLLLALGAVYANNVVEQQAPSTPVFPAAYTATVEMSLPYADIHIPLTFSVDADKTLERVDYYQGLETDFFDSTGKYKFVFQGDKRACLHNEAPHSLREGEGLVHVVPTDMSGYKYGGKQLVDGIQADRWISEVSHGTTGTMDDYIEYFHDPVTSKPVLWRMHSRNRIFDSHTDEYVVKFMSFSEGATAFTLPDECKSAIPLDPATHPVSFPLQHVMFKSSQSSSSQHKQHQQRVSAAFQLFAKQHGVTYPTVEEWERRDAIFQQNLKTIADLNAKHEGRATFKVNKYASMTVAEVMSMRGGHRPAQKKESVFMGASSGASTAAFVNSTSTESLPKNFDWRQKMPGALMPVKDQGICGSCWAFSLIAAVESATYIKSENVYGTTTPVALPEQFVIDCTWGPDLAACDGGLSDLGAKEIVKRYAGVVPTAESYGSYLTVDGKCRGGEQGQKVGAKIVGWTPVKSRDDAAVMEALVKVGPLAVAYNVGAATIYYDAGVVDAAECEQNTSDDLNHAINLVGYGTAEDGTDYWVLRNSWSTYWGEEGYFRVKRGKRDCGVSTDAGFPVVEPVGPIEQQQVAQEQLFM